MNPFKHYIAMAGLSGYLPQYCDVFQDFDSAVESLCDLHEIPISGTLASELANTYHVSLDLKKHGNEYAEIIECDCDTPQDHSEHPLEWD